MAYGHENKNTLKRVVSLGVGPLTDQKQSALVVLRQRYLDLANVMLAACFVEEPLRLQDDWQEQLEADLLALQRNSLGLNKAYAEKARLQVKNILQEQIRRHFNQLVGRLAHCDEELPKPHDARRYYYVPPSIQDKVTTQELKELVAVVKKQGYKGALALFRRVILEEKLEGDTPHQIGVLHEIYGQALQRHRQPTIGESDEWICQLHLDVRLLRSKETLDELQQGAQVLLDESNGLYQSFVQISHPIPRSQSIRLPLTLKAQQIERLWGPKEWRQDSESEPFVNSLLLELGPQKVEVKAIFAKKRPELPAPEQWRHLVGRDFGYVNTVSLSVARVTTSSLTEQKVESFKGFGKRKAKQYLSNHGLIEDVIVERKRYDGRGFLGLIGGICSKIDRLRSQIDHLYNRIGSLKALLVGGLGAKAKASIEREKVPEERYLKRIHERFFCLLDETRRLKHQRRKEYKRIRGIKKSWFGFLGNEEVKLAKKYEAALVREELSVVAIERRDDRYKGRTFNKMLNNGSKGQYQKRASEKLSWNGIPELALGSYYTSSCCIKHGLVDGKMRKGERFFCPECKEPRHADENAADTIACYLLLVPL